MVNRLVVHDLGAVLGFGRDAEAELEGTKVLGAIWLALFVLRPRGVRFASNAAVRGGLDDAASAERSATEHVDVANSAAL
jgi:hypothetical protein